MGESEHLPAVRVPQESAQLATRDVVEQVNSIQRVMKAVMKQDTHYGKIPGCKDLVLFKAGAEKLCLTFRLTPNYEIECIDLPDGHREYKVRCRLTHGPSGAFVAEGVGSCSTMESKYRWRKSKIECPSCGMPLRKSKNGDEWYCWAKKGGCGEKYDIDDEEITCQKIETIENPDLPDQYNTILKMAKKRAYVDATITATSASDIFTQDIGDPETDDEPRETRPGPRQDPRAQEADDFFDGDLSAAGDRDRPKTYEERRMEVCNWLKDLGFTKITLGELAQKEGLEPDPRKWSEEDLKKWADVAVREDERNERARSGARR